MQNLRTQSKNIVIVQNIPFCASMTIVWKIICSNINKIFHVNNINQSKENKDTVRQLGPLDKQDMTTEGL